MTQWSGLWNGFYQQSHSLLSGGNTTDYNKGVWDDLARLTRGANGRKMGALIRALTGSAVGQTASSSTTQIPARPAPGQSYSGGGVVTATVKYDINRATTAADETWIDTATLQKRYPSPYPVDKSGRGGAKAPGFF